MRAMGLHEETMMSHTAAATGFELVHPIPWHTWVPMRSRNAAATGSNLNTHSLDTATDRD
jgi:hypothetical protein